MRTLLPDVAFSDWGEMQTVPHVLGVAHPTGYPTYIMLAWVAQLVPIGSLAFRSNLLSAVLVAATLGLVVAILQRLDVRPLIAVGAALALGAVGTVWAAATVAEVNPLHLFLMTLLTLVALRWAQGRLPRDLLFGGLLVGLSVGNHLLTLFVAPFLVLYVLWAGRHELRRHIWLLPATAVTTVIGLGVYLYIPLAALRNPPLAYNHPVTLDGVLWLATGQQFRYQFDLFSPKGPSDLVANLPTLIDTIAQRATPVLPILGLIGLVLLVLRRRAFGITLIGIFVTGIFVWATYQRLEHYLLVPLLALGIGAAVTMDTLANALHWLGVQLGRRLRPDREPPSDAPAAQVAATRDTATAPMGWPARARRLAGAGWILGVLSVGFAVVLAGMNWTDSDRSTDHTGDEYVAAIFGSLPANAAILSYWDPTAPLWYAQHVEGQRPDVLIVDDSNLVYEGWGDAQHRIASLICERPVFLMRIGENDLAPIRVLYRLTPFLSVRSSALGPTAVTNQEVFRVERPDSRCGP